MRNVAQSQGGKEIYETLIDRTSVLQETGIRNQGERGKMQRGLGKSTST
jgi:hypothetical protein